MALVSACTTRLYDPAAPPHETQRVRLVVPFRLPEKVGDATLTVVSLGFYHGAWLIETLMVDGQRVMQNVDMPAGRHRVYAEVSQGTPTELGLAARWRCTSSIEHVFLPGTYELVFNRDKKQPRLRIEDKASEKTVAEASCRHVSVWSGKEIID